MRPIDWLKVSGIAFAVTALDLLIVTAAISAYAWWIDPGHGASYYQALAPSIAMPTTRVSGTGLLFVAAWLFGNRPRRNPFAFAGALYLCYYLLDWAFSLAVQAPADVLRAMLLPPVLLTTALKLSGALLGAWAARCWPGRSGSATA